MKTFIESIKLSKKEKISELLNIINKSPNKSDKDSELNKEERMKTGKFFFSNTFLNENYSVKENFNIENMNTNEITYLLDECNKTNSIEDSIFLLQNYIPRVQTYTIKEKNIIEYPILMYIKSMTRKYNKVNKLENELRRLTDLDENIISVVVEEKNKLQSGIANTSIDLIDMIDHYVIKNIKCRQFEIFIYKLKGDIYNIISLIEDVPLKKQNFINQSEFYYLEALTISDQTNNLFTIFHLETVVSLIDFYITRLSCPEKGFFLSQDVVNHERFNNGVEFTGEVKVLLDEIQNVYLQLKKKLDK